VIELRAKILEDAIMATNVIPTLAFTPDIQAVARPAESLVDRAKMGSSKAF
jgi:hypothetical protein